jgi:hypothetical protein
LQEQVKGALHIRTLEWRPVVFVWVKMVQRSRDFICGDRHIHALPASQAAASFSALRSAVCSGTLCASLRLNCASSLAFALHAAEQNCLPRADAGNSL